LIDRVHVNPDALKLKREPLAADGVAEGDGAGAETPQFKIGFGSGTGIRTLNLAVNRSLWAVQKLRCEFAESL
jgi:hypothetical protein